MQTTIPILKDETIENAWAPVGCVFLQHMGVSKNRGGPPKMDGL